MAIWPSGLRRQNQALLGVIWSERARVRIPLLSLSYCSSAFLKKKFEKFGSHSLKTSTGLILYYTFLELFI
jgi:hypothetical protein